MAEGTVCAKCGGQVGASERFELVRAGAAAGGDGHRGLDSQLRSRFSEGVGGLGFRVPLLPRESTLSAFF